MRPQLTGAAAVPLLLARSPADVWAAITCVSCGDTLPDAPPLGSGRCRPCRLAVSLIAAVFHRTWGRQVDLPANQLGPGWRERA